eukprot:Lankesteria_metandrocarpae@DN4922_c1_g1_i3.p2
MHSKDEVINRVHVHAVFRTDDAVLLNQMLQAPFEGDKSLSIQITSLASVECTGRCSTMLLTLQSLEEASLQWEYTPWNLEGSKLHGALDDTPLWLYRIVGGIDTTLVFKVGDMVASDMFNMTSEIRDVFLDFDQRVGGPRVDGSIDFQYSLPPPLNSLNPTVVELSPVVLVRRLVSTDSTAAASTTDKQPHYKDIGFMNMDHIIPVVESVEDRANYEMLNDDAVDHEFLQRTQRVKMLVLFSKVELDTSAVGHRAALETLLNDIILSTHTDEDLYFEVHASVTIKVDGVQSRLKIRDAGFNFKLKVHLPEILNMDSFRVGVLEPVFGTRSHMTVNSTLEVELPKTQGFRFGAYLGDITVGMYLEVPKIQDADTGDNYLSVTESDLQNPDLWYRPYNSASPFIATAVVTLHKVLIDTASKSLIAVTIVLEPPARNMQGEVLPVGPRLLLSQYINGQPSAAYLLGHSPKTETSSLILKPALSKLQKVLDVPGSTSNSFVTGITLPKSMDGGLGFFSSLATLFGGAPTNSEPATTPGLHLAVRLQNPFQHVSITLYDFVGSIGRDGRVWASGWPVDGIIISPGGSASATVRVRVTIASLGISALFGEDTIIGELDIAIGGYRVTLDLDQPFPTVDWKNLRSVTEPAHLSTPPQQQTPSLVSFLNAAVAAAS